MAAIKGSLVSQGRTAEIYAWGDRQVLKLFRPDIPTAWIDHEARVGRIAHEAGLGAPAIGDLIELEGRKGIIYERIQGPSMLQMIAMKPWRLFHAARQFAELHAAMHGCVRLQLPAQRDQMQRFILQAPALAADSKERVLEALERLPDGNVVCHGDYHPDNILMSSRGPIVIDWMSATRGNPLADVARTSLMFRMASLPPGMSTYRRWMFQAARHLFHAVYLREYSRLQPFSRQEWRAWFLPLAAARLNERIPQEEKRLMELVEASLNGADGR